MKKLGSIIFLFFIFLLIGCYSYSGDFPGLYTQAINSLLWNIGSSYETDKLCDPDINIIEKDSYGRVLFQYTEKSFNDEVAFSSILISQLITDEYVYYYDDYSFLCKEKVSHSNVIVEFDSGDINKLKELNDWNKELKIEKCVRNVISSDKEDQPVSKQKLKEIFTKYDGYYSNTTYLLTKDSYERFICYSSVYIIGSNENFHKYVVLLFEADLSYNIYEPKSYYDYQDELRQFKLQNHWNEAPAR